jgi:hypothetical protein
MRFSLLFLFLVTPALLRADGPKDNLPEGVRKIPPPGIKLSDKDREELTEALKKLQYALAVVTERIKPEVKQYLPDVEIYAAAVHNALTYDEFFNAKEIAVAKDLALTGLIRADALREGKHPWTAQTGLVVRGYRSRIDGSAQPYGLVIPKNYDFKKKIRLDFWCHGRGETLNEVNFIQSCQTSPGKFASEKAIVLNLYGRFCCANKLAGEVDCFEALEHVKKNYPIDDDRLVMRGFSMGGAACWHFAVHYPSAWCAAAPGAGFAETPEFLRVFQREDVSNAPWWEKKLWHMYDCTDYAANLYNLPTVAYSGEKDNQKQAADIMARAMKGEGLELVHIIGPNMGHDYEKGAKAELIERIDKIAAKGRDPLPKAVKFVTYTLRYNHSFWVTVDAMETHWEQARVAADLAGADGIKLTTRNVAALTLNIKRPPADLSPRLTIDGTTLDFKRNVNDDLVLHLRKREKVWALAASNNEQGLHKVHNLQGPIDDAFLDSFLMVRPTGTALSMRTSMWHGVEMRHALAQWRQQFRGAAPVKDDKDVTDDDIKNSNLILWGDPASNTILKRIAEKLPIQWKDGDIVVGGETFQGATHVPVLIYPNPLNPTKYVALNSGFTFREYDYLNNARQVPKLPDFAVVDVTTRANARYPGKIVTAGFFDENWQLPAKK